MPKDTFKTSILILLLGGLLTKVLGFVIRILQIRILTTEGIAMLTIINPTYSLLITIASFALPISISKVVSEGTIRSKKIFSSIIFFLLFFEIILISMVCLSANFIASTLLKQPHLTPLIYAIALTLPFISITSVLKGYFLGKLKVHPNVVSNVIEQTIRITFMLVILPKIVKLSLFYGVLTYILLNALTEFVSILVFLTFLPKNCHITKEDLKPNKSVIAKVLNTSIPSVSSRLIGNIGFFLEPIIITNFLLYSGYSSEFILSEYASYNAYAITLLTIPSFFVNTICQVLIPEVSKSISDRNYHNLKKRITEALVYSFVIGVCFSMFIFFFRNQLLNILYKTTLGSDYIFVLAPFFVLFYLEAPLSSILEACGKSKTSCKITFIGVIIKLVSLAILSLCHIGLYSLVFSEIINIIFVVIYSFKKVFKEDLW